MEKKTEVPLGGQLCGPAPPFRERSVGLSSLPKTGDFLPNLGAEYFRADTDRMSSPSASPALHSQTNFGIVERHYQLFDPT